MSADATVESRLNLWRKLTDHPLRPTDLRRLSAFTRRNDSYWRRFCRGRNPEKSNCDRERRSRKRTEANKCNEDFARSNFEPPALHLDLAMRTRIYTEM